MCCGGQYQASILRRRILLSQKCFNECIALLYSNFGTPDFHSAETRRLLFESIKRDFDDDSFRHAVVQLKRECDFFPRERDFLRYAPAMLGADSAWREQIMPLIKTDDKSGKVVDPVVALAIKAVPMVEACIKPNYMTRPDITNDDLKWMKRDFDKAMKDASHEAKVHPHVLENPGVKELVMTKEAKQKFLDKPPAWIEHEKHARGGDAKPIGALLGDGNG